MMSNLCFSTNYFEKMDLDFACGQCARNRDVYFCAECGNMYCKHQLCDCDVEIPEDDNADI